MRTFLLFLFCVFPVSAFAEAITLRFVDDAGKPVEGVSCSVAFTYIFLHREEWKEMTSAKNGRCSFELTEREQKYPFCTVHFKKTGFAGGNFYVYPPEDSKTPEKVHSITLERLRTIGGSVVDESGKPIKGIRVELNRVRRAEGEEKEEKDPRPRLVFLPPSNVGTVTDENGRWTFGGFPEKSFLPFRVTAEASDYVRKVVFVMKETDDESRSAFDGKLRIELTPSVAAWGRFLDKAGQSFKGIKLECRPIWFGRPIHVFENGEFTVEGLAPGKYGFLAKSPNHAPQYVEAEISADSPAILMPLEAGKSIRFRFVDTLGNPVSNVYLRRACWQDQQGREIDFDFYHLGNEGLQSDAEGKLTWQNAPEGNICYYFVAKGFLLLKTPPLQPREEEHTITMLPRFNVRGTVVDAETKQPIPWIMVGTKVPVSAYHGIAPVLDKDGKEEWSQGIDAGEFLKGTFELNIAMYSDRYRLDVQSWNYEAASSREFTADEGDISLRFELKKKNSPTP